MSNSEQERFDGRTDLPCVHTETKLPETTVIEMQSLHLPLLQEATNIKIGFYLMIQLF